MMRYSRYAQLYGNWSFYFHLPCIVVHIVLMTDIAYLAYLGDVYELEAAGIVCNGLMQQVCTTLCRARNCDHFGRKCA